jgi:hypothetical protein
MFDHDVRLFRLTADARACWHPHLFEQLLYRGANKHIF